MAPEGKATADSPGPPPATPTAPSAVISISAALVEQLVARINALESHQAMSIDGSSYARGVAGLPLPGEDRRVNSERSFTFDNRQASAPAQDSQHRTQSETIATMQTKFVLSSKLKTSVPFDSKDFYTWSFEFELLATTAQIWMYYDGSLPFPTEGTIQEKNQYYHESLLMYTTLLRNLSPSEQLGIRSYKPEWAAAYGSWEHLRNSYMATDLVTMSRLLSQLTSVKMQQVEKLVFFTGATEGDQHGRKRTFCKCYKKPGHTIDRCYNPKAADERRTNSSSLQPSAPSGSPAATMTVSPPSVASTSQTPARITVKDKGKGSIMSCMARRRKGFRYYDNIEYPPDAPINPITPSRNNDPTIHSWIDRPTNIPPDFELPPPTPKSPPSISARQYINLSQVTKSRDCIFYEKLTLPLFKEHREADKAPKKIFEGHRSFSTSHNEAELAEDADAADNTPTDPYPNIPLSSPLQTPTFIPVHQFDPADTLCEAHNCNKEVRRSPDAELPPPNTSQDTLRLGNDSDDDVVEVTNFHDYDRLHYEKINETGLRILGLAVAIRHTSPKEPTTVHQALSGPDIFRIKALADGSIDKYKARWVVRVFEQTHMVDFDFTYTPVGLHTSVRILICITAVKQRPLRQIDVGSALLYAPVNAIIFVEQLHAFEECDGTVCLLKKSLYGIEQAPRLWQQYLHTVLTELGFKQLLHDLGMYRKELRGKFILLVAYVDDLLYTGDDTELLDQFEADIKEKLEVTINHNVTQFRGLNITQSATSIHLSAAKYAEALAKKFAVPSINLTTPYHTPPPNHEPDTTPLSIDDHRLYQQQLGCLLFVAVTCRPDLSYVASKLAQYLKRPEGENLLDLRRALQYFVSTPDVGLTYKANLTATLQLHGYVDADDAGDSDNRRSRTGFIFQLQPVGLISWNSQKQELIALLSAEVEFIAASAAVREGLYLMELLQEAKVTMNGHFTLLCDNKSTIKIANKPGFVNRTKHIALRYFFVKDKIEKGKVKLTYCPTGDMAADFLTKKLPLQKFQHCTNLCVISKKSHVAHLHE
ncbi:unnamed protein product [Closterium sp. NIES-53]